MATLKDLDSWLERFNHFAPVVSHIQISRNAGYSTSDGPEYRRTFKIYTDTNCYTINAIERRDHSYLGCIASCRTPRAGEDWNRGRDLADGELSRETWRRILGDIVSYEMVRVHSKADALKAAEIPATPQAA